MAQAQVSTLVGGHQIVDENLPGADQEDGKSPLSDKHFSVTKDRYSLEQAVSSIHWLLGGAYTPAYMNSVNNNDLLFEVNSNIDAIEAAAANPVARSNATDYVRGERVTSGGQTWQATNNGKSGANAPTGPGSVGGTVLDGTVTFVRTV